MAKIRYYLLSNAKSELNHIDDETEIELKILVEECGLFNEDDEEDEIDNNDPFNEEQIEIPDHEVYVLVINDIVDMNNSVFTEESNEKINDILNENEEEEEEDDYDEEEQLDFEKIVQISAPSDM
jgi:hypothetical protein